MKSFFAKVASVVLVILLADALLASAQEAKQAPRRVAYVWLYAIGPSSPFGDEFAGRLRELGWVEGKTIQILYRDATGDRKSSRRSCVSWSIPRST